VEINKKTQFSHLRHTEMNGNFNIWDLAESFEEANPCYQLAVIVAPYAEMLRCSPWAAGTYGLQLVGQA
jgi:hypothetical protein